MLARARAWIPRQLRQIARCPDGTGHDGEALFGVLRAHVERNARGYDAAVLGVGVASLFIFLVDRIVHVANISLVYLFVVLWLAARFGRWPAIFASLLSFLAYDFLFVPPLYRLFVDDPAQWFSLVALLVTALVLGQLTAAVQARAREANEGRERIATLYALAQLIAEMTHQDSLLEMLAEQVIRVFGAAGVEACAIMLPADISSAVVRASAPAGAPALVAFDLRDDERAACAREALLRGRPSSGHLADPDAQPPRELIWRYLPLRSRQRVVGVLGIAGSPAIARLAQHPPGALFAAFCDQIALALERLHLQQQAMRADALGESDRLKAALLGSVSHDLYTPLAAIQATADTLLESEVDEERRTLLAAIGESAERQRRLVHNLQYLSRLDAGVAAPKKEWRELGDVLATALERGELVGRAHAHQVAVELPPDLPAVPLDRAQVEEVFAQLVENALKYSPPGSEIRCGARVIEGALEVRVVDHGIGIPADERRVIFDRFYRMRRERVPRGTQRPPMGTGLGLAVCAAIIRAHGGSIWAESTPGSGATIAFTLPLPSVGPPRSLPGSAAPQAPATRPTSPDAVTQYQWTAPDD